MKHLLYLPLTLLLFACSSNEKEQTQDYTSFVITLKNEDGTLNNVTSGYFDAKGYCWKIAEHGTMAATRSTEYTTPETILTIDVDSIYIFFYDGHFGRFKYPFIVEKNKRNVFNLMDNPLGLGGNINPLDSMQYPQ